MTTQREALLAKIRALLSKTIENGATEAEAFAALAKARMMTDVYDVGDDELALTREEKAILLREPRDSQDPHRISGAYLSPLQNIATAKFGATTTVSSYSAD